ncbi:hypothetical protein ACWGI9_42820 [Streptomyces sp. NPDC054833]
MDPEALNYLAQTGGAAIVAAMTTDAWQTARIRTVQFFQRRGRDPREIEGQLDRSVARVTREGTEAAREGQVTRWREDLEDLLHERPDATDELQTLIDQINRALPQPQQQWVQRYNITARDNSKVNVAGRDVNEYAASIDQVRPPHRADDTSTGDDQ